MCLRARAGWPSRSVTLDPGRGAVKRRTFWPQFAARCPCAANPTPLRCSLSTGRPARFWPNDGGMRPTKEVPVATLAELREEVDDAMERGDTFSTVEDEVIEPSRLPDDQKAALWLYG